MQDIASPSFLGGYANGIVELPGSMNDSHARVSKDRKDGVDEREEDTGGDNGASPSTSGAGGDSSMAPLDGNGKDSVERVSPDEESPSTLAETSVRNRRAGGLSLTMPNNSLVHTT